MKKLIVVLLLILFTSVGYADDRFTITIVNDSNYHVFAFVDSVDHGLDQFGSETIFEGELDSKQSIDINDIKHNKKPHRYILSVLCRTDFVSYYFEIVNIRPDVKHCFFIIKDRDKII